MFWSNLLDAARQYRVTRLLDSLRKGAEYPFTAKIVNAADLQLNQGERIAKVRWLDCAGSVFLVNIQVEALDRSRLLADVTRALSEQHVNILSAAVNTSKDRTAISKFTFEMADATHLDSVLAAVRAVEGVYDVYRN